MILTSARTGGPGTRVEQRNCIRSLDVLAAVAEVTADVQECYACR
jgi:hypothetical protein